MWGGVSKRFGVNWLGIGWGRAAEVKMREMAMVSTKFVDALL
jgi:hypothetical protein